MVQPRRIEKPVQLLVEGKAEQNFFEAFTQHLGIQEKPQIREFKGADRLRGFLQGFVKLPGFDSVTSIGIVRDADESAEAALRSVESSLRNAGLPAPGDAEAGRAPVVRVLILPDGEEPGMIETLLCRSVAEDAVMSCVDDFFECVADLPDVEIRNLHKARAQAYLATRQTPGVSVGVAAQKGYWPLDHDAFSEVRDFLSAL